MAPFLSLSLWAGPRIMRLYYYSIQTPAIFCFFLFFFYYLTALPVCALAQETAPNAIATPLNASDLALAPDTGIGGRRLFSRGKGKSGNVKGPVQIAWEERVQDPIVGEGDFGRVWEVKDGFPVVGHDGHTKRVPAVIKQVHVRKSEWLRKWLGLELVYLQTVGQLLDHGLDRETDAYYIVMPYMGMTLGQAWEKEMFPTDNENEWQKLADELADSYEDKYQIRHLDVHPRNMVVKKKSGARGKSGGAVDQWVLAPFLSKNKKNLWNHPELEVWEGFLIDWGYAKFKLQKDMPRFEKFSPTCEFEERIEA